MLHSPACCHIDHDIYYVHPDDVRDGSVIIRHKEFHHFVHVNRARVGEQFVAVDGRGASYLCQIESIQEVLTGRILDTIDSLGEPHFQLTIAVAIPKRNRLDWIVEKATEIGVIRLIPLMTERTVVKETSVRRDRLTRIALAAMKQSRRCVLPVIEPVSHFQTVCQSSERFNFKLIAHEKQTDRALADALVPSVTDFNPSQPQSGLLCVGPEGGFTESEVELAERNGFRSIGLGPRRLRTETAAIVASALVLGRIAELSR